MKPLYLTVLLLVLQSTKEAHRTASESEPSIAGTYSSSHFSLRRLKRQNGCRSGQFMSQVSKKCCDMCQPGTYLQNDCSNTSSTQCLPCGDQGFMEFENSLSSCFRCRPCQEENGQEIERNCTKTSNTKCRCMSNHFCRTPECKACLPCTQCNTETEVVVEHCRKTNDTVCKAKGKQASWLWSIIVVPIAVAVIALLYWRRKDLPCNRKRKSVDVKESAPFIASSNHKQEERVVPDIDLTEDNLQFIAGEIEPKAYRHIGIQLGLGEHKLQQLEADYRDNIMRQGYYILYSWLQGHGKKGAFPKLIDALRKEGYTCTADKIMDTLINQKEDNVTGLV